MSKFLEKLKGINWFITIILALLIVIISNLINNCTGRRELSIGNHKWDKLLLVLNEIEKNYVDTIDYKQLVESSLPSILQNLDPHSTYLPPQELVNAEESLEGNFSGIGVQFNVPADTAIVINVIHGGPSEKVGIMSGDRIIKVNGEKVAGVKFDQDSLVKLLKGPIGTTVNVDIKRVGVSGLLQFKIRRDKIPLKSLDAAFMLKEGVGYIKLSKFSRTTYTEFDKAAQKLKSLGMKELIFDLRDNSGGYLDQALLISNEFLPKGALVVYIKGVHRNRQDFYADGSGKCKDIRLYVLINENTASSSEIFTGAMQDNDRGLILGRRSYGKGLVQEPIYFSDKSGIRLTVARYYTPTGRSIQKPYSEDYQYDIFERYKHGEMTVADSIKKDDKLKFKTPKGKIVYGGGGIIPDVFVPLDTVGITNFLVDCNRKSLQIKFSNKIADKYRAQLQGIKTLKQLDILLTSIRIEPNFLAFAKENGVVPRGNEWKASREIIITQIEGLVGRYTSLDDDAFYPYILKPDILIHKTLEILSLNRNKK